MLAFIIRRLLQAIVVMLTVALIAFTLFRFVGDPVNMMVGIETTNEERAQLRQDLGLNDPIPIQFARFVGNAVRLDFGNSYQFKTPVIFLFPVTLGVLPSFGRGEVVRLGFWTTGLLTASGLKALILPAITLGLFQMTLIMRLVRGEMLEVLRTDYIKFARARGLTDRAVNFGHALKNTLVPVMTIAGLQLGSIIAFALITESVFQWPGMGLLFLKAVQNVDIPIMSAYLLLVAFIFVTINLIVDILYAVVDPRIRIDARATV